MFGEMEMSVQCVTHGMHACMLVYGVLVRCFDISYPGKACVSMATSRTKKDKRGEVVRRFRRSVTVTCVWFLCGFSVSLFSSVEWCVVCAVPRYTMQARPRVFFSTVLSDVFVLLLLLLLLILLCMLLLCMLLLLLLDVQGKKASFRNSDLIRSAQTYMPLGPMRIASVYTRRTRPPLLNPV